MEIDFAGWRERNHKPPETEPSTRSEEVDWWPFTATLKVTGDTYTVETGGPYLPAREMALARFREWAAGRHYTVTLR